VERVKRQYRSPRRAEQARATRRAILDSAVSLFTTQGFAATTIREIAELASVSEPSIYKVFGDKVGLLEAAGRDYAELAAGEAEAAFLAALEREPDPLERIRMVARGSRATWESGAAELELMVFRPELRDERLARVAVAGLAHKHANTLAVCRLLFPDGVRRADVDVAEIADFATAVDSAVIVRTLLALGWSMDDWEAWVVRFLSMFLGAGLAGDGPQNDGSRVAARAQARGPGTGAR